MGHLDVLTRRPELHLAPSISQVLDGEGATPGPGLTGLDSLDCSAEPPVTAGQRLRNLALDSLPPKLKPRYSSAP